MSQKSNFFPKTTLLLIVAATVLSACVAPVTCRQILQPIRSSASVH